MTNSQITLNPAQLKAVHHVRGPLLIIAGAGTGKTHVITERIKWLITKKNIKPSEIVALTFTQKAAIEMQNRVDVALPFGYSDMWIATFHAFCERILQTEAIHIGLDPGFSLMTKAESIIFLRRNLFAFDLNYFRPLGNPNKFIDGFLSHFSRLKDEDIAPSQYFGWAQAQSSKLKAQKNNGEELEDADKYLELAHAYQKYEELKIQEGCMDFGDLISHTLQLFRIRKNILKTYQQQFKFILIDEFQDTNFAQNELAQMLAGSAKNITVVGDDDQAIYRWRGAAISNIIQFRENYPKAKIVVLTKNYRSTDAILDHSYQLIQNNNPDRLEVKEKIDKKMIGQRHVAGQDLDFIYKERVEEEAQEVIEKIKSLEKSTKDTKYTWKDFAILVRANNHAEPFIRSLNRAGIPYQLTGPGQLFRQSEVKDLIAYLRILSNLDDSAALFRVLSMPVFDIPALDVLRLNTFAHKINVSLFESLDTYIAHLKSDTKHWSNAKNVQEYLPRLSKESEEKMYQFHTMMVRHMGMVKKETAGQLLYYFLQDCTLLQKFTQIENIKDEKIAANMSKFFDTIKQFELTHEDASVTVVLDWINMSYELGESPSAQEIDREEYDAVHILTIHSAKGLEFPIVFLVNLVVGRFPSRKRSEQIPIPDDLVKEILPVGDYHLEEERRLFYVGMTRSKDKLYLSASKMYGDGKRQQKISPFVVETIAQEKLNFITSEKKHINQLSFLDWKKEEEKEIKKTQEPLTYLSYSQISTFKTCPLQFKYRYMVRIPVPPSAAGSFGTSMHLALEHFYKEVQKGNRPQKNDLIQLLEKNWLPVGYASKQYELKMIQRGKDMLSVYFDKAYDSKVVPTELEKLFTIRLTPILKIGGKIDRIDTLKDGKIEIIDYKTGKKQSDKEIRENLQMTVYALAVTDKGILDKKPQDVIFSFYFFQDSEKVSTTRSKEQLLDAKQQLKQIASDIEISMFEPRVGPWCDFCDFRIICEAWQ
jgi:DNA helicase II / ATP-dependent DNA helicase PcrA